jgi:hypothetical protein
MNFVKLLTNDRKNKSGQILPLVKYCHLPKIGRRTAEEKRGILPPALMPI